MATIGNDQDLRTALNQLSPEQQRRLGSRFAEHVMHLSRDERVKRAIATGMRDDVTPEELEEAFRSAKAHSVRTYTECGKDTDWMAQADHFVAAAATAALTPDELVAERQNRAWKAAVQARMAINCAMMDDDNASEHEEARHQHRIANAFIA